jgi:Cof subfamily protein (haloacid dehalogenase superfamily)
MRRKKGMPRPAADKKMTKKAIIIDLDGTLLNSKKQVSDYDISMINKCQNEKNVIIIATARPYRTVISRLPGDFLPSYYVLCNGAWIINSGKIVFRHEIEKEIVELVCKDLKKNNYNPMIEANDTFFADGSNESWFEGDIKRFDEYPAISACKILVYCKDGLEESKIKSIVPEDLTYVITDNRTLLQISAKNCTKVTACEEILKLENIEWENTYAFGDDNNDIPVFKRCGFPIAMKNATEELKTIAKYVTDTNDNSGVGKAIETFVFKRTTALSS